LPTGDEGGKNLTLKAGRSMTAWKRNLALDGHKETSSELRHDPVSLLNQTDITHKSNYCNSAKTRVVRDVSHSLFLGTFTGEKKQSI